MRWMLCLLWACASAHAAFTPILCSDAKQSLRIFEKDKSIRVLYTGTNNDDTFLAALEDAVDDQKYEIELRFPKTNDDIPQTPACSASADKPLAFACEGIRRADGMLVTNKSSGRSHSMRLFSLRLSSRLTNEKAFGSEDKDRSESTVEIRFTAEVDKAKSVRMHVSHPIEFDRASCHTEGFDAP
jgi:hypothetical protein